jgi:hypothetical protein
MMTPNPHQNPFSITTPEDLDADEAIALFVDNIPGWNIIERPVNTIIYGFRGSGKSMALRYMEPDCQIKAKDTPYLKLPYFSVYIPIRHGDFFLSEIEDFKKSRSYSVRFLENYFISKVASRIIFQFKKSSLYPEMDKLSSIDLTNFYNNTLPGILENNLWERPLEKISNRQNSEIMDLLINLFSEINRENTRFITEVVISRNESARVPALLTFTDFLLPFLRALTSCAPIPDCPFYLFLDDVDEANVDFFTVLNSWMAARASRTVCFKSTVQRKYKSRRTMGGSRITHPHDYLNVNISDIFASDHLKGYKGRLSRILQKRLEYHGLPNDPERFFPTDVDQDRKLEEIRGRLQIEYESNIYTPRQSRDGMYRYTRPQLFRELGEIPKVIEEYIKPELIRTLGGKSKNRSTYKYCGFDEICNISGGVVRYFLESAAAMYAEQLKASISKGDLRVKQIQPRLQNLALREISDKILFDDLWVDDASDYVEAVDGDTELNRRLRNLVHSIGGMCFLCLISDRSERRVFSFAVSDEITADQRKVIALGLEKELFYQSSIGNKSGVGRSELYVFSRRLAPSFNLDPLNFAAYKWITATQLELAMTNVNSFIHNFRKRLDSTAVHDGHEMVELPLWAKDEGAQ